MSLEWKKEEIEFAERVKRDGRDKAKVGLRYVTASIAGQSDIRHQQLSQGHIGDVSQQAKLAATCFWVCEDGAVQVHTELSTVTTKYLAFENFLAVDGVLIPATVPAVQKAPYWTWEDLFSQNIMASVNLDFEFIFVLAGWAVGTMEWCLPILCAKAFQSLKSIILQMLAMPFKKWLSPHSEQLNITWENRTLLLFYP